MPTRPRKKTNREQKQSTAAAETSSAKRPSVASAACNRSIVKAAVILLLCACTLAAYWGVLHNGFVHYDDRAYVVENYHLREGFTARSVLWAFNVGAEANWHPLTWLSHMLDVRLYGLNPLGHHLTNLILHVANTLLLLWALYWMTGAFWRSVFVAALFALHPLHVESVAWVAERKDVLSTLFWMLTMLAYVSWAKRPRPGAYVLLCLAYAVGLMAKPMLVSLPFVLLVLDYWPLRRIADCRMRMASLVVEKLPLFALAAGSCVLTVLAQRIAIRGLEQLSFAVRLQNAVVSYGKYVVKMLWPSGLAIHYAYPSSIPAWQVVSAAAFLIGVSVVAIRARSRAPYLLSGWLWYVVTLVPVIGLLQVGQQSMADRYTYIPLIGLFVMIAWGLPEVAARSRMLRPSTSSGCPSTSSGCSACLVVAGAAVAVLAVLTAQQVTYWRNSETLYERALAVNSRNAYIHRKLAAVLGDQKRYDESAYHSRQALKLNPNDPEAHTKLSFALSQTGKLNDALRQASLAIKANPDYAPAYYQLGNILDELHDLPGAAEAYRKALRIDGNYVEVHVNLASVLARQGDVKGAISHCESALRTRPDRAEAHGTLAMLLFVEGNYSAALRHARLCEKYGARLDPGFLEELERRAAEQPE